MLVCEDGVGDEDGRDTWGVAVGAGGVLGGDLKFPLLSVGATEMLCGSISVPVCEDDEGDEDGRDTRGAAVSAGGDLGGDLNFPLLSLSVWAIETLCGSICEDEDADELWDKDGSAAKEEVLGGKGAFESPNS